MQTEASNQYPNEPMAEVTLYTKQDFFDSAGREAEHTAVEFIAGAFDMAEINYEVHYDLPLQTGLPERSGGACPDGPDHVHALWNDRVNDGTIEYVAKDTNILLLDRRGGGCGGIGGRACSVGVRGLQNFRAYELEPSLGTGDGSNDDFGRGVNTLLHEMGHNLGFQHDPDGGFGFNHDGRWHRTPTIGSNDVNNLCGEYTEERLPDHESYRYAFFHWCAVTNFDIANDDRTANPPATYPPVYNGSTIQMADRFPTPPDAMDQVSFETVDIQGGTGEVVIDYRLESVSDYDIGVELTLSAGSNVVSRSVVVPAGDTSDMFTETFSVNVNSQTQVEACANISTAGYT